MQAIQEAIDTFCYRDPRDKEHKPFYPQPEELKDVAEAELDSMKWRVEFRNKQKAEQERLKNAPMALPVKEPDPHVWENLDKVQVVAAMRLVMAGKTAEEARDEVKWKQRKIDNLAIEGAIRWT